MGLKEIYVINESADWRPFAFKLPNKAHETLTLGENRPVLFTNGCMEEKIRRREGTVAVILS